MRKTACFILCILLCVLQAVCMAEENDDDLVWRWLIPHEAVVEQNCPPVDDAWLTDDEDMLLAMKALRDWYHKESWGGEVYSDSRYVLLVNPFIFQTDQSENHKTIYCTAHFENFLLYSSSGKKTLFLVDYLFQAFTVELEKSEGEWVALSVEIPELGEELVPGWGMGTQGMNGVTDEMIEMMDEGDHYDRMEGYIRKYLDHTHLEDAEIDRGP